jgi:cytosine/adenosine deaminase-related metal-dependent hydrolase
MAQLLRARHVLPISAPPIEDGAVLVSGHRITAVGRFSELNGRHDAEVIDLGESTLLPGLVNAHCHLDYTMMRRSISPQRSFTEWIRRINALKRSLGSEDYAAAILRGLEELRAYGTTAVANIESFPEVLQTLSRPPIRVWWFLEMIDVRHRATSEETIAGALAFFDSRPDWPGGFGLSPHAPYTASGSLYELTAKAANAAGMPVTTHVAESREEWEMFRHARGELYDFMLKLGRWMFDCQPGRTPFGHVMAHAQPGPTWILAHMNELDESDFAALLALPPVERPSVVHCPGSHRYFRHAPFPLRRLLDCGINVCLGTDSLASTLTLSMFDEMRILSRREPDVAPAEFLKMATLNGARALGFTGGRIEAGALADLIALPIAASEHALHEAVLEYRNPVPWMMLDGKILAP